VDLDEFGVGRGGIVHDFVDDEMILGSSAVPV
jgi:hypothetical protein